jgi:hypothetical protein
MTDRLCQTFHRLRSFLRGAEQDRDFDAEMSAHLELAIEENLQRGLAPAEAHRQALVRFGGPQQAKEPAHGPWRAHERTVRARDVTGSRSDHWRNFVGAGAAFGLTRLLGYLLYKVSPRDPFAFGSAFLVLTITSLIVCLLPAWRPTRVDPIVALRHE